MCIASYNNNDFGILGKMSVKELVNWVMKTGFGEEIRDVFLGK